MQNQQTASVLCPDKTLKVCPHQETIRKHFLKKGEISGCAGCCGGCLNRSKCEYTCDAVRANMLPAAKEEPAAPARTLDQIEADIAAQLEMGAQLREMYLQAFAKASTPILIRIGECLKEEKAACRREKIPFAERIKERFGFSQRTAENYMTLASEVSPDSPIAQLEYTKALALTALPASEREQFAADVGADSMSKKQLQEAIREKQEAERRAEEAEKEATAQKAFAQSMQRSRDIWKNKSEEAERRAEELDARLQEEPPVITEQIEVVPDDYEDMKREIGLLTRRAEEAENYAAEAEEALRDAQQAAQRAQMDQIDGAHSQADPLDADAFASACLNLTSKLYAAPVSAHYFARKPAFDMCRYRLMLSDVRKWLEATEKALDDAEFLSRNAEGGDFNVT